jgi:hypothetical protein
VIKEGTRPAYLIYRGVDLDAYAYRVVSRCPPTPDDFVSYVAARRNFPFGMFFRATAVSMFVNLEEAKKLARGGRLGRAIAELDLGDNRIHVALTNARTGHISVWAPSRVLVERVVNCAEEGDW